MFPISGGSFTPRSAAASPALPSSHSSARYHRLVKQTRNIFKFSRRETLGISGLGVCFDILFVSSLWPVWSPSGRSLFGIYNFPQIFTSDLAQVQQGFFYFETSIFPGNFTKQTGVAKKKNRGLFSTSSLLVENESPGNPVRRRRKKKYFPSQARERATR